jgi:IMP dehydrogenase
MDTVTEAQMAIGLERLERLVAAGVDVAVIDTAHGYTALVLETIREVKRRYPRLATIAGNVATAEGARAYQSWR